MPNSPRMAAPTVVGLDAPPEGSRGMLDVDAQRQLIYDNVRSGIGQRFPLAVNDLSLSLEDLELDDKHRFTLDEQKRAIMSRGNLDVPVKGTWRLRGPDGTLLSEAKKTVARVPYLTPRGTFIFNGNEYTVSNQARLRPGVYTRRRDNGELEAHINLLPGTGRGFRVFMEPKTGVFKIRVGSSSQPIYPLLRVLGANDQELEESIGSELHKINVAAAGKRADISDLASRVSGTRADPTLSPEENLRNAVALMRLDPEVVQRSIGEAREAVDKQTLAGLMRKLVRLNKGEVDPDDRDAMANQFFLGPEDFFGERIAKDAGGVIRKAARKVALSKDVSQIPSGIMSRHLYGVLLNTGLGAPITQISPLEVIDQRVRVTRMGEGGISSTDSVPVESRAVQPSQSGLIDIIRGPECVHEAHEVLTKDGWRRALDIREGDSLLSIPLLGGPGSCEPRFAPVLGVHHYPGDEVPSVVTLAGHSIRMRVTGDHTLPVVDPGAQGWTLLRAEQLPGKLVNLLRYDSDGGGFMETIDTSLVRVGDGDPRETFVGLDLGARAYVTRYKDGVSHWTGNSTKIGIDTRLTEDVIKGKDRLLYRSVITPAGEKKYVSTIDLEKAVVAFPGELQRVARGDQPRVRALVHNRVEYVKPEQVDFSLPTGNSMFSLMANLVPGISGMKGGRLLMSSKHLTQAMALEQPEAPLVQAASGDNPETSYEEALGEQAGAVRARTGGVVVDVQPGVMTVRYDGERKNQTVELYNNFPLNQKSNLHNNLLVKVGDRFEPGQLLAKSNFTDDQGRVAIGRNLKVAYTPMEGNYEDGIVISESAAKKLSSEQMYTFKTDDRDGVRVDRRAFISAFPKAFSREQLDKLDDKGVVKPGAVVNYGDPLFLGLKDRKPTGGLALVARRRSWTTPAAEVWEHESPGVVTDVFSGGDGLKVAVKSYSPTGVGDKLSNRYGAKGVVTRVVPDDQMVRGEDGEPFDIVLNSQGLISRVNPVQLVEVALGKVAAKTGKPIKLPAFLDGDEYVELAKRTLREHGLKDTEKIFNPGLGVTVPEVMTGVTFIIKQHHLAEGKTSGRATGGYSNDRTPSRGGYGGAKQVGTLEMGALLGHGQVGAVIRDTKLVRGQRNDDFWKGFREGLPMREPLGTFTYDKMLNMLRASGVNVRTNKAGVVRLGTATDADVDELAGDREITGGQTISLKNGEPIKGGLFDPTITGGLDGTRWGKITLSQPVPHPLMEDTIRRVLNISAADLEKQLGEVGGAQALATKLGRINLDDAIADARREVTNSRRSARDKAVKRMKALMALRDQGLSPRDLVITKVPVLPPAFRPVSLVRGTELTSDVNLLYQDLLGINDSVKKLQTALGDDHVGDERVNLYRAVKAVFGVGDPVNVKTMEKGAQGLLRTVFGKHTAKTGLFQYKVLANAVDTVGRSVIVPDNSLNMDEVGLPEDVAWEVYKPFVVRRLTRAHGRSAGPDILRWVGERDPRARKALEEELKLRPVLYTRAPALHKYNVMAAWPRLVPGNALRISPIVTPGFNADFDGDAMNFHVPVSDEAVKQAVDRMLPSKNLFSASEFKAHWLPRQEFLLGLWRATRKKDVEPRQFATKEDAIRAVGRGELTVDAPIVIGRG